MRKWCAICLAAVMAALLLAGCKPSDTELLEGEWTVRADLALAYEDLLARADATVAAHMDLTDFEVELTLRFKEDGTYRLDADGEDLEAGAANLEAAIRKGMASYLQAQTGKTMDNLLSAASLTMDELMEKYFAEDLAQVIRGNLESQGTYKVTGGKLILIGEDGAKFFEGKYEVDEQTLKIKSGVTRDLMGSLLPLTMEKE